MRRKVTIILWVQLFSAVAVILREGFIVLVVALRAFPIENVYILFVKLLVNIFYPLFDAAQMHGYRATLAVPSRILLPNIFGTDDATDIVVAALPLHVARRS